MVEESKTAKQPVPFLRKWTIAFRPWSYSASVIPVVFGTSLAVVIGQVRLEPLRFILALLGMVILHSAANILSDVFDYRRGLDREVTPVSGAVVRGWITTQQAFRAALLFFFIGGLVGLLLVRMSGIVLLWIGLIGVAVGAFYTVLKYHALGDLAVFLNFGILGSLGAWVVQTGAFSWTPVVWAVPISMLVSAILHANNWRDTVSDRERRITTIASLLGDSGSLVYYTFLVFGSLAFVAFMIFVPRLLGKPAPPITMPFSFLLVFLALPGAFRLWKRALNRHMPKHPMDFIVLDGATSRHNMIFGILCVFAVWLDYLV